MNRTALAVVGLSALVPLLATAPVHAATPIGTCTQSYTAETRDSLAFDPAAEAIFGVIDANGDGTICFKPYPNGLHAGHAGNLVDDRAAPHQ